MFVRLFFKCVGLMSQRHSLIIGTCSCPSGWLVGRSDGLMMVCLLPKRAQNYTFMLLSEQLLLRLCIALSIFPTNLFPLLSSSPHSLFRLVCHSFNLLILDKNIGFVHPPFPRVRVSGRGNTPFTPHSIFTLHMVNTLTTTMSTGHTVQEPGGQHRGPHHEHGLSPRTRGRELA